MSENPKIVGRVSPPGRNPTNNASAHGDVGLRDVAANPTYGAHDADRWGVARLGDFCELRYGKIVRKMELSARGYPVWSGYSVVGHHNDYMFEEPQVTITCRGVGGTGNVHMTPPKCWVTNLAISIIPRDQSRVDKNFLYWAMKSTNRSDLITGSAQYQITIDHLSRHSVPLPPLCEQKSIAHILGTLDDKIELNRRMNATLEAMARALFQSWFVDFDPVRAKLDGRKPAGLDAATTALFPSHFQDSPLGHIPHGWKVGSILHQADLLSGGTPKTDVTTYWNGEISWASAKDVSQCGESFLISTERTITELGVEESSTKIIPALATVVVARGATTGRLTMLGESMAMNQTCYGLRSKVGAPFALYCHARHFINRLVQGGHGSIFDTITTSTFDATDVLLAPDGVLQAFDKQATPLFKQIRANIHQSRTLATLRDALLPKLLSGDIRVANVEEEVACV